MLRNLWGEDGKGLRSIRHIDALLKALTDRSIGRMPAEIQQQLADELAENRRAMEEFNGLIMNPNPAEEIGTQSLLKRGRVVWTGPLGSPIEDVECDEIQINPEDYWRSVEARPRRI